MRCKEEAGKIKDTSKIPYCLEEIAKESRAKSEKYQETTNNMQEARKAVDEVVNQTHVLSQLIEQLQAQNK